MLAPLFISHGAPDVLTTPSEAHRALKALPLPDGIRAFLVVSAHWEAEPVRVQTLSRPATIHDFRGFGPELEAAQYPVPGDPELGERVIRMLDAAGIPSLADPQRGLDHGAWIPLKLMRPQADIPVVQVSLPDSDAATIALGRALAPLATQGVQLIGSGALTHSLRLSLGSAEDAPAHPAAVAFRSALMPALESGDLSGLQDWAQAPMAAVNHPTPEHLRPLFFAMAAGGKAPELLHHSWSRSALAMDIWRFAA